MIRILPALAVVSTTVTLSACDRGERGASISIDADGNDAQVNASGGNVSIDTPVFKGSFQMPKLDLTAENFDVNGVRLYPGSRIGGVNVDADGGAGRDGTVTVRFDSPADVTTVRDWFVAEFRKAGVTVTPAPDGVSGRTEDKPFRIELTPAGQRAQGVVTIG